MRASDGRLHMIWLGDVLPEDVRIAVGAWRRVLGEESLRLWRDADLELFPSSRANDTSLHPAQRADIWRAEILNEFGGWYLDADYLPKEVCSTEIASAAFVAFQQDARVLQNQSVICGRNSAVGRYWRNRIAHGLRRYQSAPIDYQTGPWALTQAIFEYSWDFAAEKISGSDPLFIAHASTMLHVPKSVADSGMPHASKRAWGVHVGASSWAPSPDSLQYHRAFAQLRSELWAAKNVGPAADVRRLVEFFGWAIASAIRSRGQLLAGSALWRVLLDLLAEDALTIRVIGREPNGGVEASIVTYWATPEDALACFDRASPLPVYFIDATDASGKDLVGSIARSGQASVLILDAQDIAGTGTMLRSAGWKIEGGGRRPLVALRPRLAGLPGFRRLPRSGLAQ